jgi:hypothetical protein
MKLLLLILEIYVVVSVSIEVADKHQRVTTHIRVVPIVKPMLGYHPPDNPQFLLLPCHRSFRRLRW